MKRIKNSLSIDSASTRFSALTGNFTLRNSAVCRLSQSFLLYLITNILLAVSVTTPANAAEALGNSWRRITSIMLCAVFICAFQVLHTAHATDIACIENGGDAVCTAPEPTAWSYNLCDNSAAYASRHAAWCYTLKNDAQWNGTYGRPPCEGSRIRLTEGLLVPKAEEFTQRVDQCTATGNWKGWQAPGQRIESWNCWSGGPVYQLGIEVSNLAEIAVSCNDSSGGEQIYARRDRILSCPNGYIKRNTSQGFECYRLQEASCGVGNPIQPGTGNKYQRETDLAAVSPGQIALNRTYNSHGYFRPRDFPDSFIGAFGNYWRMTYDRQLYPVSNSSSVSVIAHRPDGKIKYFDPAGKEIQNLNSALETIEEFANGSGEKQGWKYRTAQNDIEEYDINGRLLSITDRMGVVQTMIYSDGSTEPGVAPHPGLLIRVLDSFGRSIMFTYDTQGRAITMTDVADRIYRYTYDADDNLSAVRYPDDTSDDDSDNPERIYHYEDNRHPHALTGITNEMGNRFATWNYDKQGRAISSEHAGGTERVELAYNSDKTTTVTNTQGQTQTYHFDVIHGVTKVIRIDGGSCDTCDGQFQQTTYDTSGNVASKTDFNGNVTHYTHDLERNLEIRRTKGVGTAEERTIATQWHTDFRLPIAIDVLNNAGNHLKRTAFNYDAVGRLLTRTETDIATGAKRTVTNTYNAAGLLANTDGPRTDLSDITTYEYDAHGNLIKTTNALNHETVITQHDAHGRPLRLIDVNGLVTQLAYNARGRLLSRTMDGQVTRFSYDQVGNLTGITLPNGAALTYTYDGARRLTAIQDNLGNRMNYTLDAVGNRIKEEVFDASDVLSRTHARVFNSLNQLVKDTGGEGQMRQYGYDANGNSISVIDGQNHETRSAFDVLNRLIASTDAENGISEYTYDALDNLVTVKDPKGLLTHYTYNALGDLLQLESPDTGISSYTYDAAGNRISQHDARGIEVLYRYDALNQLTGIDYPDDNTLDVTFIYDQEPNAVGRLSAMHDASGITRYQYDVRGNPITIETTRSGLTHITAYVYDSIDQLTQITYPSGRTVDYVRNALGQVLRVSTTSTAGETQVLAEGITYAPFGSMTGLAFGNGTTLNRTLDLGYRLVANTQPGILEQGFTHDGADNIIAITHDLDLARDQQLGYDPLNRLISANSSYGNTTYDYDELGNRLNKTTNTLLDTYTYDSASHHLQSITGQNRLSFDYSANGNTIAKGNLTFNYGAHNRLKKVSRQGVITAVYTYNGRGERVKKNANTITYFHYDSIGQLLAESDTQGRVIKEYVYLDGLPLALLSTGSEADTSPPAVINTPVNHSWRTVTLPEQNQRPVIIAGPPTFNGSQPGVIRLRAVSSSTVQVAFKEWNYLDGFHVEEQVTLLALAPGRHVQPDGSVWVVGTFELANTHRYQRQHFGEVLPGRPALFLTAQTANGGDTVTVRARNVSATGFDAALFEQESKMTSGHITETVGYLAIYSKNSGGTVRLNDQPVGYTLATTELYHSFKRIGSHTLKIEEERSKDRETLHIKETIALLHIAGHLFAQDVSAKGGDTSALRHRAGVVQPPTQSIMPAGAFFIHTDHLGTPQALTDDRQQIVWQAVYNPFGEATITTQAMAFNLRFPGQYFDAESGLHYNYFRYYDPGTGRYSTSDPIGLDGGLNSYGYVDGNPVNFIDPLGLASSRTTTKPTFPGPFDILFPNTPTNDAFVSSTKSFLNTIFGDAENCDDECDPPEGVKFNKVTHYSKHGRSLDPNNGSHGCMAKTGSPIHWHYDVNDKAPNGKCHTRKHVFGGCGVAPA